MTIVDNLKARGMIPKAVLYARFSSDNQREESIEAQLRAMKEYCQRCGIVVVREFIDRARSATTDDRPAFLEMIAASKEQSFDIVLVHKLDRFARNRYDSALYRRELRRNGVTLLSVLEPIDDSPEGIILESMLEGMSEYYSKNLSREVRKGMKENALKCQFTGGRPPYGLKVDEATRRLVVNEEEAPAIRFIFDSVKNGLGYNQIVQELNVMGYRTRLGKPFGKNSLYEILRNEKYRGVYVFNRSAEKSVDGKRNNHRSKLDEEIIRIEGGIEPIVDDKTFEAVARVLASRRRETACTAKESYLLAGKIFCGECGSAYCGSRKHSGRSKYLYVTYRCGGRNLKAGVDCRNKDIRREPIEDFVLREIAKIIFSEESVRKVTESYNDYRAKQDSDALGRLEQLRKQRDGLERELNNLVGVVAKTGSEAILQALEDTEERKRTLDEEIIRCESEGRSADVSEEQIRRAYKLAQEQYLSGTLKEKQQLVNIYLDKVVVYKEHVEVFLDMLPTYLLSKTAQKISRKSQHLLEFAADAGGGEGSRTPVRKSLDTAFSECSPLFRIPLTGRQRAGFRLR